MNTCLKVKFHTQIVTVLKLIQTLILVQFSPFLVYLSEYSIHTAEFVESYDRISLQLNGDLHIKRHGNNNTESPMDQPEKGNNILLILLFAYFLE